MFRRLLFLALILLGGLTVAVHAEQDHADHEELRAMLQGATTAINEERFADVSKFFQPQLRVTTVNQEVIIKPEGLEPYFRSWVGEGQYVKSMKMTMEADELTEFHGEGASRFGICRGKGVEEYSLKDGRHLVLDTRWTATVTKDSQGKWKILALHLGTNFYDNPIVAQFQAAATKLGVGGLIAGLLAGGILGYLLGRRRKG